MRTGTATFVGLLVAGAVFGVLLYAALSAKPQPTALTPALRRATVPPATTTPTGTIRREYDEFTGETWIRMDAVPLATSDALYSVSVDAHLRYGGRFDQDQDNMNVMVVFEIRPGMPLSIALDEQTLYVLKDGRRSEYDLDPIEDLASIDRSTWCTHVRADLIDAVFNGKEVRGKIVGVEFEFTPSAKAALMNMATEAQKTRPTK